ncbi:MAG: DUF479 domain-containing protein [Saprospiraceae bacterium]|nr:DUF479 domain-containing protein [Saprospiraceae bacterium]
MNYLAHCFLSCTNEDVLLGNFMTDFLRRDEINNYSGEIMEGIHLHRVIDSYTDTHPASLALRAMLRPRHAKYAPVVVDLIWDHYLSINWDDYAGSSLNDFAQLIYEILLDRRSELPVKLNMRLDEMIANDFLMAYSNENRMLSSLRWMDRRARFNSNFESALLDVRENRDKIQVLFNAFFPDIIKHVEQSCACL